MVGCGLLGNCLGRCGVRAGGCVKWRFPRIWFRCPCNVATYCGVCLRNRAEVSPEQVEKFPTLIAFVHMERSGDPAVSFKKAMRLDVQGMAAVLRGTAGAVAMFVMGPTGRRVVGMEATCVSGVVAGMSMLHRPQEGYLCPVRETRNWCMTSTVMIINMKVQPLSMRAPIEISDPYVRDGKMCARRAATGRMGRRRIPSSVDSIYAVLGGAR